MRRKKHSGEHENQERWLLTYADMITLLVAFFIMLYAMSVVSKEKFDQLALSVRSGFDGNVRLQSVPMEPGAGILQSNAMVAPQSASPQQMRDGEVIALTSGGGPLRRAEVEEQSMQKIRREIEAEAQSHGLDGKLQVSENERGLVIRILTDKLLFAPGDGHLQPGSGWLLDAIAASVRHIPNDLAIEGHTDNVPIHTAQYPSNWELSTARATNVLRYLIENDHIAADRLCAAGYADTRPIVPNDTPADRSRNRRVDIVVLRAQVGDPYWRAVREEVAGATPSPIAPSAPDLRPLQVTSITGL